MRLTKRIKILRRSDRLLTLSTIFQTSVFNTNSKPKEEERIPISLQKQRSMRRHRIWSKLLSKSLIRPMVLSMNLLESSVSTVQTMIEKKPILKISMLKCSKSKRKLRTQSIILRLLSEEQATKILDLTLAMSQRWV